MPPGRPGAVIRCLLPVVASLLATMARADSLTVADGPTVLHANICEQWGGHTFPYVLQGERFLFWTATLYQWQEREDGKRKYPAQVVGQHPLSGVQGAPAVHTLTIDAPDTYYVLEPLLLRTPDGYLHLLVGSYHSTGNPLFTPGTLRYYRSVRPEDVTEWVDRSELIPRQPYGAFHLRMNAAVTPDGERAVIAVLAISEGGDPVPWNTPVVFYGRRDGLDFRFDPPVGYHEPVALFYPQVAAWDEGVVVIGEVWDNPEIAGALLLHLDWEGNLLHEESLPCADEKGTYFAHDLRPVVPGDWRRLAVYQRFAPEAGPMAHHFLIYDTGRRALEQVGRIPVEAGYSNYGKWLPLRSGRSVFINNPMQDTFWAWEGDLLRGGEATQRPLARTNPRELGYQHTGCILAPNPCTGSLERPGEAYLAAYAGNPGSDIWQERGPCSLLLWRLLAP